MTDNLLLHPKTRDRTGQISKKPPHALLIYGPAGSGKQTLAEHIAAVLLNIDRSKLQNYPYYSLLQKPDNKREISIDSVREIIKQLQLKAAVSTDKPVNRAVVIDGAHLMSDEAQNALLKAIEEPPAATVFILTAVSDASVLPTIASRTEKLALMPVSLEEAEKFYSQDYDSGAIASAWNLSGGSAGLLDALLREDSGHSLKKAVDSAKNFLAMSKYERILFIDSLSGDQVQLEVFLDALARILTALHHSAVKSGDQSRTGRLMDARKLVNSAADGLQNNSSVRLLMLNLILRLPI